MCDGVCMCDGVWMVCVCVMVVREIKIFKNLGQLDLFHFHYKVVQIEKGDGSRLNVNRE